MGGEIFCKIPWHQTLLDPTPELWAQDPCMAEFKIIMSESKICRCEKVSLLWILHTPSDREWIFQSLLPMQMLHKKVVKKFQYSLLWILFSGSDVSPNSIHPFIGYIHQRWCSYFGYCSVAAMGSPMWAAAARTLALFAATASKYEIIGRNFTWVVGQKYEVFVFCEDTCMSQRKRAEVEGAILPRLLATDIVENIRNTRKKASL